MGIQGLLPFLKKIHQPTNVSQFSGCTVAIDAYCWLHKGAFACAEKLALGEKTDQYVYYCMKYINNLLSKNIKPIMVLDGCHLPSKKDVEKTRREKREVNRKKAAQFLREGKRAEARECLQRCIDITPEMALELMNACRDRGVDCIVAPYEADAQLAYLNKAGIAQVIITEDSDLLLFGCEKVLFKMDHAGNGMLIEQRRLNEVVDIPVDSYTFDKFRYMCILSGCDYLASLSGIGLAKANKVFKIARQTEVTQLLKKLSTYLKSNITVPQEYIDGFVAANNTFLYQLVFDPLQRQLVPLTPYGAEVDPAELTYAGSYMPPKKALQIALGNINIYNGQKFADFDPATFVPKYVKKKRADMLHMLSIWDKNYRTKPRAALHQNQELQRPCLKGKEVAMKTVIRKRSPQKRVRQAADSHDVCSNSELSNLYGAESPIKKRRRRVTGDMDDDLQRFMFAAADQQSEEESPPVEGENSQEDKPIIKLGSPQFFNSLSGAHPELVCISPAKQDNDENKKPSPKIASRNIFASKSPSKRPRFDLNAKKEKPVKSRFFSSPNSTSNGASVESTCKTQSSDLGGFKLIHTNTANVYADSDISVKEEKTEHNVCNRAEPNESTFSPNASSAVSPNTVSRNNNLKSPINKKGGFTSSESKHFKFSKDQASKSPKSSPIMSAFNWSKFKFQKLTSSNSSPDMSCGVKQPFKNVVSGKKLSNSGECLDSSKISDDKGSNCESSKSEEVTRVPSLSQNDDNLSQPEHSAISLDSGARTNSTSDVESSYPYSIDSMCISQSALTESGSQSSQCDPGQERAIEVDQDDGNSVTITRVPSLSQYFNTTGGQLNNLASSQSQNSPGQNSQKQNSQCSVASQKSQGCERSGKSQGSDLATSACEEAKVVFTIDSDDEMETAKPAQQTKASLTKSSSVTAKGQGRGGCRVSGLSRKSRKSNSKPPGAPASSSQPSLKDMFSKFAFTKNVKSSSTDDINEDAWTPESGDRPDSKLTTSVPRKLI